MFFSIYKLKTFYKKLGFLKRNFKECFKKLWKHRNKGIFQKTRNSQTGEFLKTYFRTFKNIF